MSKAGKLTIAFILVLLLFVVTIMPKILGYQSQRYLKNFVENLATTQKIKVSDYQYHGGWFSSSANFVITLTDQQLLEIFNPDIDVKTDALPSLQVSLDIDHGPLIKIIKKDKARTHVGYASITGTIVPTPSLSEQFKKINLTHKTPLMTVDMAILTGERIQAHVNSDGFAIQQTQNNYVSQWHGLTISAVYSEKKNHMKVDVKVNNFTVTQGDKALLDWAGITGQFERNKEMVKGQIDTADFKVNNAGIDLHITPVHWDYSRHFDKNTHLWFGETTSKQDSVVINYQNTSLLNLENITGKTVSDVKDQNFSFDSISQIEKVGLMGRSYGPLELKTSFKNISTSALKKFQMLEHDRRLTIQYPATNAQLVEYNHQVLALVPEFFGQGAQVTANLVFHPPEGAANFTVSTNFPNIGNKSMTLTSFLQATQTKINMVLPQVTVKNLLTEFLKQTTPLTQPTPSDVEPTATQLSPEQQYDNLANTFIARWQQQGWLQTQGNNYVIDINFNKAQ